MTDNRFSYSFMINRRNIMIIKNGIVADPASDLYEHMDILVKDGKIEKIAPDISCASDTAANEKEEIIDAAGMIIGPGLIDLSLIHI